MNQEVNARYNDADLEEFKQLILEKIEHATTQLHLIESAFRNDSDNGTDDTSPTFKAFCFIIGPLSIPSSTKNTDTPLRTT